MPQLTSVEFQFYKPDGTPLADTSFSITLKRSGFITEVTGVVVPDVINATTDVEGKVVVPLQPSSTPYFLQLPADAFVDADCCMDSLARYKFYVPEVADGVIVRAQELFIAVTPSNIPYDEEAILIITEAKLTAVNAAREAKASAELAEEVAQSIAGDAESARAAAESALLSKNASAASANAAAQSAILADQSSDEAVAAKDQSVQASQNSATSAGLASQSSVMAERWASDPENTVVADGKESSYSYSRKSADSEAISTIKAAESQASAQVASEQAVLASTAKTSAEAAAGTATTKASEASASAATSLTQANRSKDEADRAANYASSLSGALVEAGPVDLSSNTYPPKPTFASIWKVTVGGVVGGVDYGIGDSLVYSKSLDSFYKIDNTESVSSVNGKTGVAVLNKADIGLSLADNTPDTDKPVSTPQQTAINGREPAIAAGVVSQYLNGLKQWVTFDTSARLAVLTGLVTNNSTVIAAADSFLTAFGKLQAQITTAATNMAASVRSTVLTGVSFAGVSAILATDTVLEAFGKLQAQVTARLPLAGGSLTGPITSNSSGTFPNLILTSPTDTMINGGDTHNAIGLGAAVSLARNTNMVSEFIVASDNAGFAPRFNLLKSAGTVAAPVALANTNLIGAFQFVAYNGTSYAHSASIAAPVDGTPGSGFVPGCIQFNTVNASGVSAARWQLRASGNFEPCVDNAYSLGSISTRVSTIYAATGTINTSDAREKTTVSPLTANEVAAAKDLGKEIGTYKWLASINEKGSEARQHIGMTVQRAIAIMELHGLNPMDYGFICYNTWDAREIWHPEEVEQVPFKDKEGETVYRDVVSKEAWVEKIPAGDRYSFRYDELNLFIAAGFEARLSALEGK